MNNRKYMVVKDMRTEKLYLDFSDTMIRTYEKIIATSSNKRTLEARYKSAADLTRENIVISQQSKRMSN